MESIERAVAATLADLAAHPLPAPDLTWLICYQNGERTPPSDRVVERLVAALATIGEGRWTADQVRRDVVSS